MGFILGYQNILKCKLVASSQTVLPKLYRTPNNMHIHSSHYLSEYIELKPVFHLIMAETCRIETFIKRKLPYF